MSRNYTRESILVDLYRLVAGLATQLREVCSFPLEVRLIPKEQASYTPPFRGYPCWRIEEVWTQTTKFGPFFSKTTRKARLVFWIEADVDGQRLMRAGVADRRVMEIVLRELADFKERHNLLKIEIINPL